MTATFADSMPDRMVRVKISGVNKESYLSGVCLYFVQMYNARRVLILQLAGYVGLIYPIRFHKLASTVSYELKILLYPWSSRSTSFTSCRRQTYNGALMYGTRQRQLLLPRSWIPALDALELLHQSNGGIASFREGELLPNADSRSAVERKILLTSVSLMGLDIPSGD